MPVPNKRSRSLRKVTKKMPGGRLKEFYFHKKPSMPQCADCGKVLHGVAHGRASELKKISKSERRPQRPYGGVLCSSCSRKLIIEKARALRFDKND